MNTIKIEYVCVSHHEIPPPEDFFPQDIHQQIEAISDNSAYTPGSASSLQFIEKAFAPQSVPGARFSLFLATHNEEVLGYLEMRITFDDAEIDFVAVDPAFRRLGIGKHLVSNSVQHAIKFGARRVLLEVGENNHAATALYRELGFSQTSVRKNYYKNGENALIMERKINALAEDR